MMEPRATLKLQRFARLRALGISSRRAGIEEAGSDRSKEFCIGSDGAGTAQGILQAGLDRLGLCPLLRLDASPPAAGEAAVVSQASTLISVDALVLSADCFCNCEYSCRSSGDICSALPKALLRMVRSL